MSTDPVTTVPAVPVVVLQAGPYSVDPHHCTVQVNGGPYVVLTRFEMGLLAELVRRAGQTVSKEQLAEVLYPGTYRPNSNGLEVFVKRIRRKIDPQGQTQPIKTVRYSGYMFRADWSSARAAA